jgi:hypothetical protein
MVRAGCVILGIQDLAQIRNSVAPEALVRSKPLLHLAERTRVQVAKALPATLALYHKAGMLQHSQVLRYAGPSHIEVGRQRLHWLGPAFAQDGQQLSADRTGQHGKNVL